MPTNSGHIIICVYNISKITTTKKTHFAHQFHFAPLLLMMLCLHWRYYFTADIVRQYHKQLPPAVVAASAFYVQKSSAQHFTFRSSLFNIRRRSKNNGFEFSYGTQTTKWSICNGCVSWHITLLPRAALLPLTPFHTLFTCNTILERSMVSVFLKHLTERKPTVKRYVTVNTYTCV